MIGFKQFIEALSSHGGFAMTKWDNKINAKDYEDSNQKKSKNGYKAMKEMPWVMGRDREKGEVLGASDDYATDLLKKTYKKTIAKLDERLIKLKDFNIHLYFGLPKQIGAFAGDILGSFDLHKLQELLDRYFFSPQGMNIPKSDIVFVKTGPSGDVLTPWMILHTVGHALFAKAGETEREEFEDYIGSFVDENFHANMGQIVGFLESPPGIYPGIINCLFNFRSARIASPVANDSGLGPVESINELLYELVASYLWHGGKIARPNDACIKKLYEISKMNKDNTFTSEDDVKKKVDDFYNHLDDFITQLLNQYRGEVLVDLLPAQSYSYE
jgi:hypothetical protein